MIIIENNKIKDELVKIAVQINGKVRTELEVSATAQEMEIKEIVLGNTIVQNWVKNQEIKRFIYIKTKLVNIVV